MQSNWLYVSSKAAKNSVNSTISGTITKISSIKSICLGRPMKFNTISALNRDRNKNIILLKCFRLDGIPLDGRSKRSWALVPKNRIKWIGCDGIAFTECGEWNDWQRLFVANGHFIGVFRLYCVAMFITIFLHSIHCAGCNIISTFWMDFSYAEFHWYFFCWNDAW